MYNFLSILIIIVLFRGFIIINEQFLVAICFVSFIGAIIFYSGDDIKNSLETKKLELLSEHLEFQNKTKNSLTRYIQALHTRKTTSTNLIVLHEIYENNYNEIVNVLEAQFNQHLKETILNELNLMVQLELNQIPLIQHALVHTIDCSQIATSTTSTSSDINAIMEFEDLLLTD